MTMFCFFFFNDTATTEIYTLSLHDALPICLAARAAGPGRLHGRAAWRAAQRRLLYTRDRKSTRLNSSHVRISYAVFCLKKKNQSVGGIMPRFSPPLENPHSSNEVER